MIESMNLLKAHWTKFSQFTVDQERDIIEQMFSLIKSKNRKIKENASDTLESFLEMISLREGAPPRDLIHYFVTKVKHIINNEEDPVEVMVCIRCFGHLASLVKRSLGQEELKKHFLLLFEISQNRVLDDITDSYKNTDNDTIQPENFKKLLYRQKQLNSHIKAFALIVKEMEELSEPHARHLLELFMVGVKKHKLFFEGYKKYLYLALVQLIMSLSNHTTIYKFWMKKAVAGMLNSFVELSTENRELYDQDMNAIKSAADFIVRLIKQEKWVEEKKVEFLVMFFNGLLDFLRASDFGYDEIIDQGKKLYIPRNHEDQHLTFRLALIFEEIQRQGVLDVSFPDVFPDLLGLVFKGILSFPRTSSLQKLFRSLLSCAERLETELLEKTPENQEVIVKILETQFIMLRELRGDILMDFLRCLLGIPSLILKKSQKLLEVFKRALLITLETAGPQSLFMIDHSVHALERILIKDKVEMREGKEKFLQEVLPYFAALLDLEVTTKNEGLYTLTVKESQLEKETVLKRCITFLGSLGSDLHYIAKGRAKENELEQTESDSLKISIPIYKHKISLNLNHLIKRASQLALESPNEEVQSAACELFHGSMIVYIGKCSQGSQAGEDFVESLESSIPYILKLANNSSRFAPLFRELLFQMARWLSFNKEEESPMVSSFIGTILSLAGQGDKPEVRSLCLQGLEQFLHSTCKTHLKFENQSKNFGIFFRKVEALTLHPDSFKRLAGLMSLKLMINLIGSGKDLIKNLFFEICYYFLQFVRKQERLEDKSLSDDAKTNCDEIFSEIKHILKSHSDHMTQIDTDSSKFSSINDLFLNLQKNLLTPEYLLRDYSLQLWLLIRSDLPSHLSSTTLKNSLSFLDSPTLSKQTDDDPVLAAKYLSAKCATLSCLLERSIVQANHLKDCELFKEIKPLIKWLCSGNEMKDEKIRRGVISEIIDLAGNLKSDLREDLLSGVRSPDLSKSIIQGAFESGKGVTSCKRVLEVLGVDMVALVKEYVNSHGFRFDSYKDPLYQLHKGIPARSLEAFFSTILEFMRPEEVSRELLNQVRIYHMLKFIKSTKKTSSAEIVTRCKILLRFLLETKSLKENEIAEYLDPFNQAYDNFSSTVQNHISLMAEEDSRPLIKYLFMHSKKDHNLFTSIVGLLAMFVSSNKRTDIFFDSFNETFDPEFIQSHDIFLKNILNLGIIFLQEGRELAEGLSGVLLEQCLSKSNRSSLGLLSLEFLGHFSEASNYEKTLIMYRRLKQILMDYSRDILPVIFEDYSPKDKHTDGIVAFANKIFDLVRGSKMVEPFEVIFPLIRNKKRFRQEISSLIESTIATNRYDIFLRNVQFCIGIFKDSALSDSFEFNIRFSIIERVLLPLLENTKEEHLREIFIEIYPTLSEYLTPDVSLEISPRSRVLNLGEKSCCFKILELFFRKLSTLTIKEYIHPRLMGPNTQKNEITKKLIVLYNNTRLIKRKEMIDSVKLQIEKERKENLEFATRIINDYYCSAYSCLVSVLMNTQTKESPLTKHLLTSDPSKNDFLLENLVDLSHSFSFTVYTNFVSENLRDYYKIESTTEQTQKSGVRQFVARLTANSLFTQTLTRGRIGAEGLEDPVHQRQQLMNLLGSQETGDKGGKIEMEKGDDSRLEMDAVNQHPIMRAVVRLVDHLASHFPTNENPSEPKPAWVGLLVKLFADHTGLNQRIVLLKIVLNRPDIFKPYKSHFNQYLLEYIGQKETGGSGLHYFMRDVCTTLLVWNSDPDELDSIAGDNLLRRLSYEAMKNVCKKLADESRPIFLLNIDVFQKLCHLMKKILILDSGLVMNMLIYEEKKPVNEKNTVGDLTQVSILWRITGISILETAIYEGIELGTYDQNKGGLINENSSTLSAGPIFSQSQKSVPFSQMNHTISSSVSMDIEAESSYVVLHEKLLLAVLANMRTKKKGLCSAAFRLAGIYLQYLNSRLPYSHLTFEQVTGQVVKEIEFLIHKEANNLEENICELCKVYPEIAIKEQVLVQLTYYIIKTSGKKRSYVFDSLKPIFSRCLEKPEAMEGIITELTLTLQSNLEKILRDNDPINYREFLLLITEAAKLKSRVVKTFLETCIVRVCEYSLKLLRQEDVGCYFNFVVLLHENYSDSPEILSPCKRYMIIGLASSDEHLRNLFMDFLNNDPKTRGSEEGMLTYILKDLYSPEFEHHWLTTSAQIVLSLSRHSSQKNDFIFEKPLTGYVSSGLLTFPTRLNVASQMTQPLIPFSLGMGTTQPHETRVAAGTGPSSGVSGGALGSEDQEKVVKAKIKYNDNPEDRSAISVNYDEPISIVYNSRYGGNESALSKMTFKTNKVSNASRKPGKPEFNASLRKYFQMNQITFNQVSQTEDNKLRIIDQLGVKAKKQEFKRSAGKEEVVESLHKTLREYRQGELPDIQIKYSDLLKPLTVLASQDARMAQLIFVPLFIEVHNTKFPVANQGLFKNLLQIIDQSQGNYQVINTIQTILYELSMKSDNLQIDPSLITKTGTGSLSFGGAALLLEDMLSKIQRTNKDHLLERMAVKAKSVKKEEYIEYLDDEKFVVEVSDNESINLILNLIEIYKQMNEDDVLRGLYRLLHETDKYSNDVFIYYLDF